MLDGPRSSYDLLPYIHGSVPLSHPARIGAIARLLGLDAAAPDRARVLEIGCGIGLNLLPLAERFPEAEFVGLDSSELHIDLAVRAQTASGLQNVRFIAGDIVEFTPEAGQFDYVIAHGFYSWTAPEVADRLLTVCAQALAPEGVAYVSYNTYPGWGLIEGLRRIVLPELDREQTPSARVTRAEHVLATLTRAFAQEAGPHAAAMRQLLAELQQAPMALTLHDALDAGTSATTFRDFVDHALRHGLHFLSEAHFASMPVEHLSAEARTALAELNLDAVQSQQFLDLLGGRRFRATLLSRAPLVHPLPLVEERIRDCAVATSLRLERPEVDLSPEAKIHLLANRGLKFAVSDPAQKALLAGLISRAPEPVPFTAAVAFARQCLEQSGLPVALDELQLIRAICRLFSIGEVDLLLAGSRPWLGAAQPARLSPLTQFLARENLPMINRWHQTVQITDDERRWIGRGEGVADVAHLELLGLLG